MRRTQSQIIEARWIVSHNVEKGAKNKNFEARNLKSETIQMTKTKICKIQSQLLANSMFSIFPILDLFVSTFVSDFDIWILNFVSVEV